MQKIRFFPLMITRQQQLPPAQQRGRGYRVGRRTLAGRVIALLAGLMLCLSGCGGATATPSPAAQAPLPALIPTFTALPPAPTLPLPTNTVAPAPPAATLAPTAPPTVAPPTVAVPTKAAAATVAPTIAAAAAAPTTTPAIAAPLPPRKGLKMSSPEFGMHAFLWWRPELAERDLLFIKTAGFTWVKQIFSWNDIEGAGKGKLDWSHTDQIVTTANKYGGLDLLVRVDHSPEWARAGCSLQGPPKNLSDYGDFLTAVATRYKGRIRAYQIWNEPNLAREWCDQKPNAADYVALLKVAYQALKKADPDAMVISAGLSPTTENSNRATPDTIFLDQMYKAGLASTIDVLGIHAAGFKFAPEADPADVAKEVSAISNDPSPEVMKRVYCFRHAEDLRAIMVQNGDSNHQVAILEFGWTSDTVNKDYTWFAVSEETKADYLVRAYKWAKEHWSPWIGVMSLIYIANPDWTKNDEQYWWSITNPDGSFRPAYLALKAMAK